MDGVQYYKNGIPVFDFLDSLMDCEDPDAQFIIEEPVGACNGVKVEQMGGRDHRDDVEKLMSQSTGILKSAVQFFCDICHHETRSKKLLRRHVLTHMSSPLKCDFCDYETRDATSLKKHAWIHSSVKPYVCDICDYQTSHFAAFKTHKWKHTGEKPYACELCSYRARQRGSLRAHMASRHDVEKLGLEQEAQMEHSITENGRLLSSTIATGGGHMARKGGWFVCPACDYKTLTKHLMIKHIMSHSGEKPYACDICDYRCIEKQRLRRHMMVHTGEKPFSCNLCSYRGTARVLLQRHMRKHTEEKKPRKTKYVRNKVSCPLCDYECSTYEVAVHIAKSHGEPPYHCRLCDYKAGSSKALNRHHSLKHSVFVEKSFPCEVCTYSSNNTAHLRDHMMIHTGEKPYACDVCSFRSRQKGHLKIHMMMHTGEKPYACDKCGYRTNQKGHLKGHLESCGRSKKQPKPDKNQPHVQCLHHVSGDAPPSIHLSE